MKRIFLIFSAFIILMLFAGCNNTEVSQHDKDNSADVPLNTDLSINSNTAFAEFRTRYIMEFYGMHDFVAKLVDEDRLSDWMTMFETGERSLWEMTLLSQVTELEISQEALLDANRESGGLFSDEQIKSLYSGDIKKVNEAFANPYSLVVDGEIFTPDWLTQHSPDDYIKNGITSDILKEYMIKIDIPELNFAYASIAINANAID